MKNLILAIIFIVIAYLIASPFIAAYQLKQAIEKHDSEELTERIDFPTLRQNVKDQLNETLVSGESSGNEVLEALGAMIGGFVADRAIDAYLTPEGLANLFAGAHPGDGAPEPIKKGSDLFHNVKLRYSAWDRFTIAVPSENGSGSTLVLRRRGLGWKVTNVLLSDAP